MPNHVRVVPAQFYDGEKLGWLPLQRKGRSMKFTINMTCDNAAFEDEPAPEVARILRSIANKLDERDGYDKYQTILDVNGNDVGRWRLGEDR
jgi:hypothetical protein